MSHNQATENNLTHITTELKQEITKSLQNQRILTHDISSEYIRLFSICHRIIESKQESYNYYIFLKDQLITTTITRILAE